MSLFSGILLSLVFIVAALLGQAEASHQSHAHFAQHHALHAAMARRGDAAPNTTTLSNSSAEALVAEAQARIAIANKLRMDRPRFNKLAFNVDNVEANSSKALPIISTRGLWTRENASVPIDYSIPPALLQAAKEVAESRPHESAVDKYAAEAAALKAQYWLESNDTNTPTPAKEPMNELGKRDSTFWMASMNMNGRAPYGGATYTVFRNVKDYGAVGDGIHDDTAAINNAVKDGGRCGMSCGSSTAKPAVVYFPAGTYLVSASIIQYYNTQFLGDPTNRPIILAASSFSGLGVISSDVYIDGGNGAEWYVPQNNFLRSVRNFIVDITNTPSDAYVCGIHWQVAQGTDLQNIDFYMKPGTTQQGIYMENGSGGFLSDLYFYGGNFGAYLGNQQFTSRNLLFQNCLTAIQVHWDWAWTMQGITIVGRGTSSGNPSTGITIVGGAGGAGSTGQGVGSFILLDSTMSQLTLGISTTLLAENSTSLLLQNVAMSNVVTAVQDSARGTAMLAGGASVSISSWGFGNIVTGENGTSSFQNGNDIPAANRSSRLTAAGGGSAASFFARSAPTYKDVAVGGFMNIKSYGARGDGTTDDTAIINQVLAVAANASQIVFFPYGMYMVSDTVRVPLGSRIVGQVWPQIVATGSKFEDMRRPRPVVQVGVPGDVGTVEISDMMVSVRGPTAGAVLMEWNVHEETQGSAALWNTHLRVGGSLGSSLQAADCPKLTGSINPKCAAASLLLHLTPTSSAYVQALWGWVADHDIDIPAQTQIDVYSGRGILIESQGPSWFWGTASEHSVMYQYQLSNARDIFFSMIQTESPYFQPGPKAPAPFAPGVFPADPDFTSCSAASTTCAFAWALRMLDSSSVYIYSSGLYSWFSSYSQACVDAENCQDRGVDIENSSGVWMYALATKAIREMVSPVKVAATMAAPNQNGYLSSILAWLEGSTAVVGTRFPGWSIFPNGSLADAGLTTACEAAMYQTLKCDVSAKALLSDGYQGNVGNSTALSLMCDPDCYDSLRYLHGSIVSACASTPELLPGWPLVGFADMVWAHWNETCFKDPTTGQFCDSVLSAFSTVSDISQMPRAEMCSYCNLQKYDLMRKSAFSVYDNATFETRYRYVAATCNAPVTSFDPTPYGFQAHVNASESICTSHQYYTSVAGDTCDSVAVAKSVSSATLFWINPSVWDCSSIPAGTKLCLPLACPTIHTVTATESCLNITTGAGILTTDLSAYNPGLNWDCDHLHNGTIRWGSTLCISPPGGGYTANSTSNSTANPWTGGDGYHDPAVAPPPGAVVAAGTTTNCGGWYKHADTSMSCAQICLENQVTYPLFLAVNPSLHDETCSAGLVVGTAYCIHPTSNWNTTSSGSLPSTRPSSSTKTTSTGTSGSTSASVGTSTPGSSTSTTRASTSSSTSTSPTPSPTSFCTGGTGPGGYLGLCDFSCHFGFCPAPCTCTATGTPNAAPPATGGHGYALVDLAADFGPLCDFACSHGYCPDTACTTVPYTTEPPSDGGSSVCVRGAGAGGYAGLCSFGCHFGFCPAGPCTCALYGAPVPAPPETPGVRGVPLPGLDPATYGPLCDYACGHGYCPDTACARAS